MPVAQAAEEPIRTPPKCVIDLNQDFLQFDSNLDNKITLQEMYDQPMLTDDEKEKAQLKDMRYQMFYAMDTDSSDDVTREEMRAYEQKSLPNCEIQ